ncbi:hypothetical protein GLOTRDRAFT_59852 [Gloeophyllum trabeum ATCC 11539]|uniref:Flavin reductase like domain-containing protein n=1 Tax=Gloeophyllum trabeum (strain ATCC 11539 / FP-39264 / Madison 617) TaxID=670483 RepID=S7QB48_GLOTA|nr:uncharacterized protein GLOTRDRAFT_59852 [Gloeophyllum trabeum ATCC 11539]EPQ56537.1 hypothetical protein GLOTRDRAFT_59852 [Gloeophyllum trabeum ATCC 11539]
MFFRRCTSHNTHRPSLSLCKPYSSSSPSIATQERLRALLRETAQPVAVVTSRLQSSSSNATSAAYHGATLSSFSSIAMDPHPLIAFSLRLPSRMATALKSVDPSAPSHMVVNILSAAQMHTAISFSRVDLHPEPFKHEPYTLTKEGLPMLEGSLGALSCKMVSSWPLHDLELIEQSLGAKLEAGSEWSGDGVASELFVARVVRVEKTVDTEDQSWRTLPLLYHRRTYATTSEMPLADAQRKPQNS